MSHFSKELYGRDLFELLKNEDDDFKKTSIIDNYVIRNIIDQEELTNMLNIINITRSVVFSLSSDADYVNTINTYNIKQGKKPYTELDSEKAIVFDKALSNIVAQISFLLNLSNLNSESKINPFDLPRAVGEGAKPKDIIRSGVISLKGLVRLMPILAGILVGYAASLAFGIVDFTPVTQAAWLAMPNFVAPEFNWHAILFMIPVAIAPAVEHIGDILAISNVTGKDYLKKPGLHRTLTGDGIATIAASALGGPPNTTYSEVTGAVTLTKSFDPRIMTWTAITAITLAFVGKLGALMQTIPVPVMGGIMCLLFGSIAAVGLNTLIRHQVDLSEPRNLSIVGVTLVFGIGGMAFGIGSFSLTGISLCGIVAIIMNLILPVTATQHKE